LSSFSINHKPPTHIYTLSLHDALPILATFFIITDKFNHPGYVNESMVREMHKNGMEIASHSHTHCDLRYADLKEELNQSKKLLRSEEHTYELQSRENLVCRLLLEKKNK